MPDPHGERTGCRMRKVTQRARKATKRAPDATIEPFSFLCESCISAVLAAHRCVKIVCWPL